MEQEYDGDFLLRLGDLSWWIYEHLGEHVHTKGNEVWQRQRWVEFLNIREQESQPTATINWWPVWSPPAVLLDSKSKTIKSFWPWWHSLNITLKHIYFSTKTFFRFMRPLLGRGKPFQPWPFALCDLLLSSVFVLFLILVGSYTSPMHPFSRESHSISLHSRSSQARIYFT